MIITKKLATAAKVGLAAGAVVALAATSADAAGVTYRISAGKATAGSVAYSGKTTGNPGIKFVNGAVTLVCKTGSAHGNLKLGRRVAAAKFATIGRTGWVGCSGGGLNFTVKQAGTWTLNGTAKTTATGVTAGYIGNVTAHVAAATASQCNFTVSGSVNASYSNRTHKLSVHSVGKAHRLTVSKVVGCFGLVSNGQHPVFTANYAITSPKGAVKI